jgi:uncharacterized protein YgbK (DUF1537 family)
MARCPRLHTFAWKGALIGISGVTALGLESFRIGPEIDPGVPVLEASGRLPMLPALKSRNFGGVDFYAKALRMMEVS